jgi:hypothetical protein
MNASTTQLGFIFKKHFTRCNTTRLTEMVNDCITNVVNECPKLLVNHCLPTEIADTLFFNLTAYRFLRSLKPASELTEFPDQELGQLIINDQAFQSLFTAANIPLFTSLVEYWQQLEDTNVINGAMEITKLMQIFIKALGELEPKTC